MSRAIAISHSTYALMRQERVDLLRRTLVLGCGVALIFAGAPLPF